MSALTWSSPSALWLLLAPLVLAVGLVAAAFVRPLEVEVGDWYLAMGRPHDLGARILQGGPSFQAHSSGGFPEVEPEFSAAPLAVVWFDGERVR